MHYSQLQKQGSSPRKNGHPGTPRPNLESLSSGPTSPRPHHSVSSSSSTAALNPHAIHATNSQEHLAFNFKQRHQGKSSSKGQQSQRNNCGLPKHDSSGSTRAPSSHQNLNDLPTNSPENLPSYLVWVKNEPFDFGLLSPLPCPKIGINILRKIAEYCRQKPGHFPELTLNQWNHICKYKMQLATDLCFTYFRVFDILTRPSSTWTQHYDFNSNKLQSDESPSNSDSSASESWDAKFHRVVKQGHDFHDEFKVDTMQFLLFLYLQHFLRLHKKYFLKSYGDEPWPKAWVNNLIQRSNGAGIGANVPEQQQAEFIMANLPDMIDFLMLLHENKKPFVKDSAETGERPNSAGSSHNSAESPQKMQQQYQRIPLDVIKALSLILGVATTTPANTEFKSLDECLHLSDVRWKLEYSRYSRTVDKKCFIQWVMKNLKINPWGPSSVPIPQVPVSVITGVWDEVEYFGQNKIFWNTQSFPKTWYLISGVEKQVLVMDTLEPLSSIKIHRCTNSFIYLPGVYTHIIVQKCHDVTLNIGVTTKVVKFTDCSGITVSAVGRQFIIMDVSRSTFYLLSPSSPVICGSKNHEIFLAPYNTSYPNLISHMKAAGISTKIQRWNRPLEISNDGFPRAFQQSNVVPLVPEQFKIFPFPFRASGSASNLPINIPAPIPGTLPTVYQRRVEYPLEKLEEARKEFFLKLKFSEEDTSLIYQITLHRFKKWLRETGYHDQIVGLRSLQKSLEQERSLPVACSKGHDLSCVAKVLKSFFKGDFTSSSAVQLSSTNSVRSSLSLSSSNRSSRHSSSRKHEKLKKEIESIDGYRPDQLFYKQTSSSSKSARGRGGAGDEGSKDFDELDTTISAQFYSSSKNSSKMSVHQHRNDE